MMVDTSSDGSNVYLCDITELISSTGLVGLVSETIIVGCPVVVIVVSEVRYCV
jgi:hypothetical protein